MQNNWLSAHLFYTGPLQQLLRELVIPLLQRAPYPAFFIRYWEDGPHIRLRMQVPKADIAALKTLLAAMSRSFFAAHPAPQQKAGFGNTIRYIRYEPEIARYGNIHSIQWAERQFIASSDYVLQQLQRSPEWTDAVALQHAVKLNLAVTAALEASGEMALGIARRFIAAWLPRLYDPAKNRQEQEQHYTALLHTRFSQYAPVLIPAAAALWKQLQQGAAEPQLQQFLHRNREVFTHYRQLQPDDGRLQNITGSFMHMGHNRLGISNLDEAYIMFFTLKCLEPIYAGMESRT